MHSISVYNQPVCILGWLVKSIVYIVDQSIGSVRWTEPMDLVHSVVFFRIFKLLMFIRMYVLRMYIKVKRTYFINQSVELLVLASYTYVMTEFITDAELEAIIFTEILAKFSIARKNRINFICSRIEPLLYWRILKLTCTLTHERIFLYIHAHNNQGIRMAPYVPCRL